MIAQQPWADGHSRRAKLPSISQSIQTNLSFMQLLLHDILLLLSSIGQGKGFCQTPFQPGHVIPVSFAVLSRLACNCRLSFIQPLHGFQPLAHFAQLIAQIRDLQVNLSNGAGTVLCCV